MRFETNPDTNIYWDVAAIIWSDFLSRKPGVFEQSTTHSPGRFLEGKLVWFPGRNPRRGFSFGMTFSQHSLLESYLLALFYVF